MHRAIERVVGEPALLLLGEALHLPPRHVATPQVPAARSEQTRMRSSQHELVMRAHARLRDVIIFEAHVRQLVLAEQPFVQELLEIDQQFVAGEARHRHVGTEVASTGPGRQDLPDPLPSLGEQLDKTTRLRSEPADAKSTGQRRRMQQDPGESPGAEKFRC
jgi:hypothetical protein